MRCKVVLGSSVVMVAPCESFGRWHRWRTIEVVADRRDARAGHAIRMLRCERCGTAAWRWAPLPVPDGPTPERVPGGRAAPAPGARSAVG